MDHSKHQHPNHDHTHHHSDSKLTVKDPVCGMNVDPNNAKGGSSRYEDHDYYFCNPKCKTKFDLEPAKYLSPQIEIKKLPKDVEYTCPMHPEVRQIGPGSCPICGMALEPVTISLDHEEDNSEYLDMRKRFWVGTVLSIPLLFITMGGRHLIHSQGLLEFLPWLEVILASPVVV